MKTMVVFSGGLDSTTLVYHLLEQGHEVMLVGFDYGQRHAVELSCARGISHGLALPYTMINLTEWGCLLKGSSQTDPSIPVPHGHYQADNMKATVVPNRNMVMLSLAASIAISEGCEALAYGAHAGDHTVYPDCRPGFIQIMREAFLNCDWSPLQLVVPFQDWTKGDIVKEGLRLEVPYELTYTCYEGKEKACGLCGSCVERLLAFEENKTKDPLNYKKYE